MLPSKNSSWFLWAVKGTKKKIKKGKGKHFKCYTSEELLKIILGKTKTRETGKILEAS